MKRTMPWVLAILIPVALTLQPADSAPLVIRCTGYPTWGDKKITQRIDIVLPEEQDRLVTLSDWDAKGAKPNLVVSDSPVGVGSIEINEFLGDQSSRSRHKLIVTLYNAYGRLNPFSVSFNKIMNDNGDFVVPSNLDGGYELVPTSISVAGIIPSINYQFRF